MSSVILKGFGDGHSQSPAKETAQEKLSEVKMRSHLLTCFEKKQLTRFPNERRKAREYLYFPTQEIELYYTCLMPETYGDSGTTCYALDCWSHHKKWTGFVCLVCKYSLGST